MSSLNIEIKAETNNHDTIRQLLIENNAEFRGVDEQKDTYFKVPHGRLKIREGNVESCIVFYIRDDINGPKSCSYHIEHFTPDDPKIERLREILSISVGVLCVVDKKREIYFIDNVKFHLDTVEGLGTFFEIEVIQYGDHDESKLMEQCEYYLKELGIDRSALLTSSYSDMIIAKQNKY